MDATRTRRTKDLARRVWYAGHRQRRFARHMGFAGLPPTASSSPLDTPQVRAALRDTGVPDEIALAS
jgi:hypothetical protein